MSLVSQMFNDSNFLRPTKLFDQKFGLLLDTDDVFQPVSPELRRLPAGYIRNWQSTASRQDCGSTVDYGKDQFTANLDVQQFKPEEISVKVTGENTVTVEGKHEEKEDDRGNICRHFIRRYVLPKEYDMSGIESKLSLEGVLSIHAPRIDAKQLEHKSIPVNQTGKPVQSVEEKAKGEEDEK